LIFKNNPESNYKYIQENPLINVVQAEVKLGTLQLRNGTIDSYTIYFIQI